MNIAFFSSHNGSAMRAVYDAIVAKRLDARICLLIVNTPSAPARNWAEAHDIPCVVIPDKDTNADARARDTLRARTPDLIILGGYLRKIGPLTLKAFAPRILNTHPSRLPAFGGKGMYGLRVHSAVLASGAYESGATIHIVGDDYDRGPIVAQNKVPVREDDTPETLRNRVMDSEKRLIIETIRNIAAGHVNLNALTRASHDK